eukprot:15467067-Alexandrium_andersonii.AAC.1
MAAGELACNLLLRTSAQPMVRLRYRLHGLTLTSLPPSCRRGTASAPGASSAIDMLRGMRTGLRSLWEPPVPTSAGGACGATRTSSPMSAGSREPLA